MKQAYNNPTANNAIGAMQREWRRMARLAVQIREGRHDSLWVDENILKFTGIYKRLLDDPIEEVRKEAR